MARPSSLGSPTKRTGSEITRSTRRVPREQLVAIEGVVEREHAHFVADRRERRRQRPTDLLEGRTLLELRVLRFQRFELALQLVVLAVGELGFVAVVALAVVPDELRQRLGAVERLRRNAVLRFAAIDRNLPTPCDGYEPSYVVVVVGGAVVVVVGGAVVGGAVVGRRCCRRCRRRWRRRRWSRRGGRRRCRRGRRRRRGGGRGGRGGWRVVVAAVVERDAAITPTSTMASTINAAMSHFCAGDIPPSSVRSGG